MTDDNANTVSREESESLAVLLKRKPITVGLGPFFIVEQRQSHHPRVCPFAFDSVEEAAAFMIECFPMERLPPDALYTISVRLDSAWVQ